MFVNKCYGSQLCLSHSPHILFQPQEELKVHSKINQANAYSIKNITRENMNRKYGYIQSVSIQKKITMKKVDR